MNVGDLVQALPDAANEPLDEADFSFDQILAFIRQREISPRRLARALGVPHDTLHEWRRLYESIPREEALELRRLRLENASLRRHNAVLERRARMWKRAAKRNGPRLTIRE